MKQTLLRLILITLFYLIFRYLFNVTEVTVHGISTIALLFSFVVTYIFEPMANEKLSK